MQAVTPNAKAMEAEARRKSTAAAQTVHYPGRGRIGGDSDCHFAVLRSNLAPTETATAGTVIESSRELAALDPAGA